MIEIAMAVTAEYDYRSAQLKLITPTETLDKIGVKNQGATVRCFQLLGYNKRGFNASPDGEWRIPSVRTILTARDGISLFFVIDEDEVFGFNVPLNSTDAGKVAELYMCNGAIPANAAKEKQMSSERHFLSMWSQEQFYDKAREIVSSVISVQGDNQRATKKVMTLLEDIEYEIERWIGRNGPGVNPIITSERNVYMRAKAHKPPLRSVRDLEPGYWLVRWRDVYNDGYIGPWEEWHVMQIDGEAPFLKAMLLMPLSLNPIPPVNIGELLEASDADERVQFAGPIRPPDTDT